MFDVSKLTFTVLREGISEYNVNSPVVVGRFKTVDEAVASARAMDKQRSRVIIEVTGWEVEDDS